MKITLYSSKTCATCSAVENKINTLLNGSNDTLFTVKDIAKNNPGFPIIVPSVFINDVLFSIGDFDSQVFLNKIYKNT